MYYNNWLRATTSYFKVPLMFCSGLLAPTLDGHLKTIVSSSYSIWSSSVHRWLDGQGQQLVPSSPSCLLSSLCAFPNPRHCLSSSRFKHFDFRCMPFNTSITLCISSQGEGKLMGNVLSSTHDCGLCTILINLPFGFANLWPDYHFMKKTETKMKRKWSSFLLDLYTSKEPNVSVYHG